MANIFLICAVWCLVLPGIIFACDLNYTGNMCDIDQDCLKQHYEESNRDPAECRKLYYPDLYSTSDSATFGVKKSLTPGFYAEDPTFAVISIKGDSFKFVPDCCGLKWNETTCTLPSATKGELFKLFAPLPPNSRYGKFCQKRIQVRKNVTELDWCQAANNTSDCLYIRDGAVDVRRIVDFASSSFFHLESPADYCFFDAPDKLLEDRNASKGNLVTRVENVKLDETSYEVGWEDTVTQCIIRRKLSNTRIYMENHNGKVDHTLCYFAKVGKWETTPTCVKPGSSFKTEEKFEMWILLTIIGFCIIILVVFVILCWVYRTQIRQCFPYYGETKQEIVDKKFLPIEEEILLPDNRAESGQCQHTEERVYPIRSIVHQDETKPDLETPDGLNNTETGGVKFITSQATKGSGRLRDLVDSGYENDFNFDVLPFDEGRSVFPEEQNFFRGLKRAQSDSEENDNDKNTEDESAQKPFGILPGDYVLKDTSNERVRIFSNESDCSSLPHRCSTSSNDTGCDSAGRQYAFLFSTQCTPTSYVSQDSHPIPMRFSNLAMN